VPDSHRPGCRRSGSAQRERARNRHAQARRAAARLRHLLRYHAAWRSLRRLAEAQAAASSSPASRRTVARLDGIIVGDAAHLEYVLVPLASTVSSPEIHHESRI
jgi:hypothetical protein